jgi:hypothetical protein
MTYNSPGYLIEIENSDWISEVLSERFDNALTLMTKDSIIFGGAIRDCLAGKELLGDLDIVVTPQSYPEIFENFLHNPRWLPFNNTEVPKAVKQYGKDTPSPPFSKILFFKTNNSRVAQIMVADSKGADPMEILMNYVRSVDILCCGVAMTYDGRVFEALPGALEDCRNEVLRVNTFTDGIPFVRLDERVKKLTARGWKNEIDVEKVMKDAELSAAKAEKKRTKALEEFKQNLEAPSLIEEGSGIEKNVSAKNRSIIINTSMLCEKYDQSNQDKALRMFIHDIKNPRLFGKEIHIGSSLFGGRKVTAEPEAMAIISKAYQEVRFEIETKRAEKFKQKLQFIERRRYTQYPRYMKTEW